MLWQSDAVKHLPQDSMGDGGLYTLCADVLLIVSILVLFVLKFGKGWRERSDGETEKGLNDTG